MPKDSRVPSPDALIWPALRALKALGGSASHQELLDKVVELENIPETVQNIMHAPTSGWTKLSFCLGVAKIAGGKAGILEVSPSTKGLWVATEKGKSITEDELRRIWADARRSKPKGAGLSSLNHDGAAGVQPQWKDELLQILRSLRPEAFERLSQRVLRTAGFIKVEVKGKSGDGGIDGFGVLRVSELLSFHVYFQCKRYVGTVSSAEIRDFRGAIAGRTDKGLFITTGTFTAEATKEANRDGVSPIDLVDGDRLCELLKGLGLGVNTRMVEDVVLDAGWFSNI